MGYSTVYAGQITLDHELTGLALRDLEDLWRPVKVDEHCWEFHTEFRGVPTLKDGPCQWIPSSDKKSLIWDGNEKFYSDLEWITWLKLHLLQDYQLNGMLYAVGEETGDMQTLLIKDSVPERVRGLVDLADHAALIGELTAAVRKFGWTHRQLDFLLRIVDRAEDLEDSLVYLGRGSIEHTVTKTATDFAYGVYETIAMCEHLSRELLFSCRMFQGHSTLAGFAALLRQRDDIAVQSERSIREYAKFNDLEAAVQSGIPYSETMTETFRRLRKVADDAVTREGVTFYGEFVRCRDIYSALQEVPTWGPTKDRSECCEAC